MDETMTKDDIRAVLGEAVQEDGSLRQIHPYIDWTQGPYAIVLDGVFDLDDIEAIAAHMRAHGAK